MESNLKCDIHHCSLPAAFFTLQSKTKIKVCANHVSDLISKKLIPLDIDGFNFVNIPRDSGEFLERVNQRDWGRENLAMFETTCDKELIEITEQLEHAEEKALTLVKAAYQEGLRRLRERYQQVKDELSCMLTHINDFPKQKEIRLTPIELLLLQDSVPVPKFLRAGVSDVAYHIGEVVLRGVTYSTQSVECMLQCLDNQERERIIKEIIAECEEKAKEGDLEAALNEMKCASAIGFEDPEYQMNLERQLIVSTLEKEQKLLLQLWRSCDEGEIQRVISALVEEAERPPQSTDKWRKALVFLKLRYPQEGQTASAYFQLGTFHFRNGNYNEAEEAFSSSLSIENALDPNSEGSIKALSWKIAEVSHPHSEVRLGVVCFLGLLYMKTGRSEQAKEILVGVIEERDLRKSEWRGHGLKLLGDLMYSSPGHGGLYREAEQKYIDALSFFQTNHPTDITYGDTLYNLGLLYHENLGNFIEAEQRYIEALSFFKTNHPTDIKYGYALNNLGLLYHENLSKFTEAVQKYIEALSFFQINHPTDIKYGDTLYNLGSLYHENLNKFTEAEQKYIEALSFFQINHPTDIKYGYTLNNLGLLYHENLNKFTEAEQKYIEALSFFQINHPTDIKYGYTLNNLGLLYHENLSKFTEAEQRYIDALSFFQINHPTNITYGKILYYLGLLYHENLSKFTEAEQRYIKALSFFQTNHPTNITYGDTLYNLGSVYHENLSNFTEAEQRYIEALSFFQINHPTDSKYGKILYYLGSLYHKNLGNFTEAEQRYIEALSFFKTNHPTDIKYGYALNNLGLFYHENLSKFTEAEQRYIEALSFFQTNHPTDIKYGDTLYNLGSLYHENLSKFTEAEQSYNCAIKFYRAHYSGSESLRIALYRLGLLYEETSRLRKAVKCVRECLDIDLKNGSGYAESDQNTLRRLGDKAQRSQSSWKWKST